MTRSLISTTDLTPEETLLLLDDAAALRDRRRSIVDGSTVDTTLRGFYNVTKPVLKRMLRNKRGSVVSRSSAAP